MSIFLIQTDRNNIPTTDMGFALIQACNFQNWYYGESTHLIYFINSIFKIKQFRKKKRSLHEATARKGRKQPNIESKRNSKNTPYYNGFYLNDSVRLFNKRGYITGFCSGGCYVKDIQGNYITVPNKKYKQINCKYLQFIKHNNNWQLSSGM